MKRIIVLIDGTWNKEGVNADTNVAKLDPKNKKCLQQIITPKAADGTIQEVFYHDGVGSDGGLLERLLGGAIGLGLKQIVQASYNFIVDRFKAGHEIYLFGFSRGAYAARALAGMIGASGIQRQPSSAGFELAWKHYRIKPAVRKDQQAASSTDRKVLEDFRSFAAGNRIHPDRTVKCVGVWDTVGSYGVPAGFGLAPLARYITVLLLGFHDTSFGDHINVGLHAVGIDERRRPFVPTFWTIAKGHKPRGHVEQTWFAGVHANVGGSYPDPGLSDLALIWLIARVQSLAGLEFDKAAVRACTNPNIDGEVFDSSKGWPVSQLFPHHRVMLSPEAVHHGYFFNVRQPDVENINEKIHWSALAKRGRPCTVFGVPNTPYNPENMPLAISSEKVAAITPEEQALLDRKSWR
jgi:uncharacterized protein (DUF2235 family)